MFQPMQQAQQTCYYYLKKQILHIYRVHMFCHGNKGLIKNRTSLSSAFAFSKPPRERKKAIRFIEKENCLRKGKKATKKNTKSLLSLV